MAQPQTKFATVADPIAVRVTRGTEELRNLVSSGITKSPAYAGDVFVSRLGDPLYEYAIVKEFPTKQKAGYAIFANPENVTTPDPTRWSGWMSPEHARAAQESYRRAGFGVFEGGLPASDVTKIQKITFNPASPSTPIVGPERSFERFQAKWEGLSAARKARTALEMGRDLRPAASTLRAALGEEAALAGRMALRGVGRLAGPIGAIATGYDLATTVPAMWRDWADQPTYIADPNAEEKIASQALSEYRTGPRSSRGTYQPPINYYQPSFYR